MSFINQRFGGAGRFTVVAAAGKRLGSPIKVKQSYEEELNETS
jgi:hypothetical protein